MTTRVDLNADLGEVSGCGGSVTTPPCSASSPAPTRPADSMPATRRVCAAGVCRQAAQAGVRIGAQIGYRDLAGFGLALHRRRSRRSDGRCDLPDRGTAGTGLIRRRPRRLRQTARRAVQHHRHRHSAGPGRGRRGWPPSTPACRCSAGWFAFFTEARRPGTAPSPKVSPTAPTWRTPPWCPAASAGAVLHDATEIADRVEQMVTTGADHRGRRHAHRTGTWNPFAYMVIHRAQRRSRGRCGTRLQQRRDLRRSADAGE